MRTLFPIYLSKQSSMESHRIAIGIHSNKLLHWNSFGPQRGIFVKSLSVECVFSCLFGFGVLEPFKRAQRSGSSSLASKQSERKTN